MYPASEAFHQAIRDAKPQMPLLIFDDCILSAQDVNVSDGGLRFSEMVGDATDFAPGGTPSSTLTVNIFNEDGALTNYQFSGTFRAKLGVLTAVNGRSTDGANTMIRINQHTISGHDTQPYLRIDNAAAPVDTTWAVKSIVAYNGVVYAFGTNRRFKAFTFNGTQLSDLSPQPNLSTMIRKSDLWVREKYGIQLGYKDAYSTAQYSENSLSIQTNNQVLTYQFVPLGTFKADRPTYNSRANIQLEAFDLMTLLDEDWDDTITTYPVTLNVLLGRICDKVSIPHGTFNLSNGDLRLTAQPDAFQDATMRDVVSWIAEVTGYFAKMNRNGQFEMRWFANASYFVTNADYTDCDRAYYDASPVQRLVVINTGSGNNGHNLKVGSGQNTYYLRNNPIAVALL